MIFKESVLSAVLIIASFSLLSLSSFAEDEAPQKEKPASKELDLSGFSKLNSSSDSNRKFKATCTSRYSGTYKESEKGFEACMSEFEQSKFKETSKNPQHENPHNNSPSVQFSTELNSK